MPGYTGRLIGIFRGLEGLVRAGTEVGVWRGKNAKGLLEQFPELMLNLVDCYEQDLLDSNLRRWNVEKIERMAHKILRGYRDRCCWYKQRSVDAAKAIPDASQDFVFIDANHDYESVREDIKAWLPKVRPGGILCGHDYCHNYEGCIRAVDEAFGDRINVTRGHFPVWWLFL